MYSVTKCKAKSNNLSHIYLNPALLQSEIFVNCYCDIKQKCIYLISIIKLLIVHSELHYDKCIFVFHCFNKCIWFIPRGGMFLIFWGIGFRHSPRCTIKTLYFSCDVILAILFSTYHNCVAYTFFLPRFFFGVIST